MSADPEVSTEPGVPEEMAGAAAPAAAPRLPLQSALLRDVEQLHSAVVQTASLLTETTEQLLPMRAALATLMSNLRLCRHCIRRKKANGIVSRLLIAGPAQSGKSAVLDFIFQPRAQTTLETAAMASISPGASTAVLVDGDCSTSLDSTRRRSLPPPVRFHAAPVGNYSMNRSSICSAAYGTIGGLLCKRPSGLNEVEECDEVEGILCPSESLTSAVNSPDRGSKLHSWQNPDDVVPQDATLSPFLGGRARRRQPRWNDGQRSRPFLKLVKVSPFPETHLTRSVSSDAASFCTDSTPFPCALVASGGFETTVVDRIRRSQSNTVVDWLRQGQNYRCCCLTNESCSPLSHSGASLLLRRTAATSAVGVEPDCVSPGPSKLCPAHSWLLQEGAGGVVRGEHEGTSFVQLPDSLRAEAVFFTLPCELVGTHRMLAAVNKLFHPFAVRTEDDAAGEPATTLPGQQQCHHPQKKAHCAHAADDREAIRQLISDMTCYVLTFSDAILVRSEGVHTTDKQLSNRPPPMAGSLPELIALFQKEMRRLFDVHVEDWQVIPFSGPMSRVTRDALTAIYEKRFTTARSLDVEETLPSASTAGSPLFPASSTALLPTPPVAGNTELNAQSAIAEYCDVVYGQRFKQRQDRLSPEQLEEVVWQHALRDMWRASGAQQLLRTARCFEWNFFQNTLFYLALSLVLCSRQLQLVLPQAQKSLRLQVKGAQNDLRRLKREDGRVSLVLRRLREECIPRQMSQVILHRVQEQFEELTLRFWWTLVTLLDEENVRYDVYRRGETQMLPSSPRYPPLTPSASSVEARERLCKRYRRFLGAYVAQRYETQMSQLQSIIREADARTGNATLVTGVNGCPNDAERTRELPSGAASVLAPDLPRPAEDVRHHIPFVEANARELKRTMRKELSLLVARLNTEVINYFMAELVIALPGFVKVCEVQRELAKRTMLQLVTAVNSGEAYDPTERKLLRSMLSEIPRFPLLEMRPNQELETFVTGLRSALCQDQVKLYVKQLDGGWDGQCAGCAATTSAYLAKSEEEGHTRQLRSLDFVQPRKSSFLRLLREHRDIAWAPMEVAELTPPSAPSRVQRSGSVVFKRQPSTEDAAGATATPAVDTYTVTAKKHPHEGDKATLNLYSDIVASRSNPIWFFLAVWQEALSAMTFSPWLLLHGVRYATLLNNITFILLKGQARLEAVTREESCKAEATLQSLWQEKRLLGEDLPSSLQHLSTTAKAVACEMKSLNADTFRSLSV
ncbi:uncharacterized protein Tco025E_06582 [Trypanosoma conorhini]|uniref:Uncharacterized protein n=1 Tax=Trypanosoma conorhini TaxID=83891 RepID=A0A422P1U4_9TRYP|nr:uncharacterized protein Tco025E_06582 [Trypanosoma conorhini]RNF11706.1 hypothetical protein Tco025E_06582 [Trypanosoma conorhini]